MRACTQCLKKTPNSYNTNTHPRQFDDYPIMPLKHWYPSLYASDRGIDSDNIVIPDLVEDLCKGKERGDEDRRRTRRTTASTDGSRSLKEVYWDVSELPNYLEEMSRTDPKYELQEKWQEVKTYMSSRHIFLRQFQPNALLLTKHANNSFSLPPPPHSSTTVILINHFAHTLK